jgi:hypothetical protein
MRSLVASLGAMAVAATAMHARAEVINVRGCPVNEHVVDDGGLPDAGQFHCEPDFGYSGGTGGSGSGGSLGEDVDEPTPMGGGFFDEPLHKVKCRECGESATECLASARLTEDVCVDRMADFVRPRCDAMRDGGAGRRTSTPWGKSLADLGRGARTGESAWDARKWGRLCWIFGGTDRAATCWGEAMRNCEDAWASDHPGVSVTETDAPITFSVEFSGVHIGGQSKTIEYQYSWNAQTGYRAPCEGMAEQLAGRCISAELSCYAANRCAASERR